MTETRLTLVHVVLEMGIGGLQRLITDTTLAMDPRQFTVEVICLDELGCFADMLRARGIRVTLLSRKEGRLALFPWRLARLLRERRADVVHMHPGTLIFGAIAARLAGVAAAVYTEHGRALPESRMRLFEDRVSGVLIDRIIAVSADLADYLARVVRLPRRKIVLVTNGIPVDSFARGDASVRLRAELGLPAGVPVLGTVARLDAVKDQRTMLEAFALLRLRHPDARLLMVGEGPMRPELESYIAAEDLGGAVLMTGQRNDIPALVSLMDVFILSSLSEGTSISLLEAMASGVTPVVTRVGGNPAVVTHGVDGLLVEPRDAPGLAEALGDLVTDARRRRTLGDAARAKVRASYGIETMVSRYVQIYREILGRKRRRRSPAPALPSVR